MTSDGKEMVIDTEMEMTIDIETTWSYASRITKGKVKLESDKGDPFNEENRVLSIGYYFKGKYHLVDLTGATAGLDALRVHIREATTLIGHNIKFDVHWLRKLGVDTTHCRLEDTMMREYLLHGGAKKMEKLGLDTLAPQYGGFKKIEVTKHYWNNGCGTEDIPKSVLHRYLYMDVWNTHKIYQEQKKHPMYKQVRPMMDMCTDLNSVTEEMEYKGMAFDSDKLDAVENKFKEFLADAEYEFNELIYKLGVDPLKFNPGSAPQKSELVYSLRMKPTIKPKDIELDAKRFAKDPVKFREKYKREPYTTEQYPKDTWKERHKGCKRRKKALAELIEECFDKVDSGANIKPIGAVLSASGFSTNGESQEALIKNGKLSNKGMSILQALAKVTKYNDWLNKCVGQLKNGIRSTGFIHGNFNQIGTASGRYSASKPNLQNQPAGKNTGGKNNIRACFVSRYGDDGYILAVDYSQLELRTVFLLSDCKRGFKDYDEGIDIHTDKAKWAVDYYFGDGTWEAASDDSGDLSEQQSVWRNDQKAVNFGLMYGRFPKDELEEAMFEAFFNDYPEVKIWNERVKAEVLMTKKYICPLTGCYYNFERATEGNYNFGYDDKGRGWRNKGMNYPVQGLGGRIMQTAMITMHEQTLDAERIHFIGQVHDEVLFDLHKKELDKTAQICFNAMEGVGERFEQYFGKSISIVLEAEATYGKNWFKMEKYKRNE